MWDAEDVIKASEEGGGMPWQGQVYILPPVVSQWFVGVRDMQAMTDLIAACDKPEEALEAAMKAACALEYRFDKEALALWKSLKGAE